MRNIKNALLAIFTMAALQAQAGDKIKCYFNHAVDNTVSGGVNAVNLNGFIDDTLIAYIDRAKYTLDITMYNFTSTSSASIANVATAVNNAYTRGVRVRWLYDSSNTNSGMTLLNAGINKGYRTDDAGIMHDKFMIIDAKSTNPNDAVVWTGSTNWSKAQFETDYNNVIIIQDSSVASAFLGEFNQMWGDTGAVANPALGKFGNDKDDLGNHHHYVGGKHIEVYFSPSDNTNGKILNTIATANKDLYFGMYAFTFGADATAIVGKYSSGVYVAGILDTFSASNSTYTPYPTFVSGITRARLKVYSGAGLYHNKYMIVDPSDACSDPIVLTGSHNWSNIANTDNDENTVIIHDDTIANQYYQSFKADFAAVTGTLTAVTGGCGVSVDEVANADGAISLFPNPANGFVNLTYSLLAPQQVSLSLIAADGRIISVAAPQTQQPGSYTHAVSLPAPGLYVLRVVTGEKVFTTRIVNY